jgi:hypothetical protein
MNTLKYFFSIALVLSLMLGCKKDSFTDTSFTKTAATSTKLSLLFDITQDNSGLVTITPNGEGAVSYDVVYGDATTTPVSFAAGKNTTHVYAEGVYTVKVTAHDINGNLVTATQQLTVSFRAPEKLVVNADFDPTNLFKLNVSATALYETMFKVYYGDVANEVPVTFLEGATVSHTYLTTGTFTVKVIAYSGGAATTTFTKIITIVDPVVLPITFESTTQNYAFTNFNGGVVTVINNPKSTGINTSAKVAQMVKGAGEVWGGSFITLGKSIDFSANKVFRMKVFSPRVGARVLLKVENAANTALSFEKEVATTLANTWEDLAFDYSAINTANTYEHIVLIFDNGTKGDGTANYTFLLDDIRLTNSMPSTQMKLPVTFDDATVNYSVTDFGNNQTVDAVDPTLSTNKVKKTTKISGAETWAGTTLGTGGNGFPTAIPLSTAASQMTMRVYSPAAGIHVRLKIEDHTNSTVSVETEAITTVANTWETLNFDFKNQAAGTAAINYASKYDMASVFFDFGNLGTGKVFYWDDVILLAANAQPAGVGLPLDFESSSLTYTFNDFNGGNATVISNPKSTGIDVSSKVGKMVKNADQTWGGSWIGLASPIDFSTKKTFTMKVYSPRVGARVLLKVENLTDGTISYEKEVATTSANAWELLTFDYSAINAANSYQKVVLIFDNGTMGDGSANFTFYFDDITLK